MTKLDTISFYEAREKALGGVRQKRNSEVVMLENALFRVLAKDVICQKNLPSFNNSAMDGFAFRFNDRGKKLKVALKIFAGDKPEAILKDGECYQIMTGAKVPSDADTIAPIENCTLLDGGFVVVPKDIKKGSSLRLKGEEQKKGEILLEKGTLLQPADIALLSSQGIVAVEVFTKVTIAVVSTGDEIREPWEDASEDEIYNANAYGITSMLKKFGFAPSYVGAIPDSLEKTIDFIEKLKKYDAIITTGGISMGEADFLNEAFIRNGLKSFFHGVMVKPGRPTMMGEMGESFVMAMPGNPLTSLVNTFLLSLPVLFKMQGSSKYHHAFTYAKNKKAFKLKKGRANVILGDIQNGEFEVANDNKYGSGMITPMCFSNAVAIFEAGVSEIKEGEFIKVILLDSFALSEENGNINGN